MFFIEFWNNFALPKSNENMNPSFNSEFNQFLSDIKTEIREAQHQALLSVNKQLIDLYLNIGQMIVERQEAFGWGKSVVKKLSKELQKEFPGIKGFSTASLWRMRTFYQNSKENTKLAPLVREISWTKNVVIFEKCKDPIQQEFYLKMARKYGWTKKCAHSPN